MQSTHLHPKPLSQAILLQLLAWTLCHTVEPGEQLADRDGVFSLRGLHADRQSRRWAKWHSRENTPAKCGDGFDSSFVEALGGNLNGVLDTLGVGE